MARNSSLSCTFHRAHHFESTLLRTSRLNVYLPSTWKHSKMRGFAASPINTDATRKPENRDETCWKLKTSVSCETSSYFRLCSDKIDVFLRVFSWASKFATSKSMFRARPQGLPQFSSYVTKCSACHGICTLPPLDEMTMELSKVLRLPRKCNSSSENDAKVLHLSTKRLLTHFETRLDVTEVTRSRKLPKVTALQNSP